MSMHLLAKPGYGIPSPPHLLGLWAMKRLSSLMLGYSYSHDVARCCLSQACASQVSRRQSKKQKTQRGNPHLWRTLAHQFDSRRILAVMVVMVHGRSYRSQFANSWYRREAGFLRRRDQIRSVRKNNLPKTFWPKA